MRTRFLQPLLAASLVIGLCRVSFAADSVSATAAQADGKKININQASVEQLAYLPRVGSKAAQRIVDYRKGKGPFARPEDLMEVKGFGEKKFEQLRPYLTVTGPTTLDSKVSSAGSRGSRGKSKGASKRQSAEKASGKAASHTHTAPVGKGQ